MVAPIMAAMAGAGAGAGGGLGLSSLASLLPFAGGLLGGGSKTPEINVSQSATNTTSVNLTSVLHNLSPGNTSNTAPSTTNAGSASGAGSMPPSPSPLAFPYEGVDSAGAAANVAAGGETGLTSNPGMMVAAALVIGGAVLFLFGKKRG